MDEQQQQQRPVADRDLRSLSTVDLLALIKADIAELDQLHPPKPKPGRKGRDEPHVVEVEVEEPEPEPLALHAITCCNVLLGEFPPFAKVRCPYCGVWRSAKPSTD